MEILIHEIIKEENLQNKSIKSLKRIEAEYGRMRALHYSKENAKIKTFVGGDELNKSMREFQEENDIHVLKKLTMYHKKFVKGTYVGIIVYKDVKR